MIHQRHRQTKRQTDDMQSQDCALHYSASCGKKDKECASDLNDPEHQNEIFWIAKQMVKEIEDTTGSNCLKEVSGKFSGESKAERTGTKFRHLWFE